MKWLFTFLVLTLTTSEISAFKLQHDKEVPYNEDWNRKQFPKQRDRYQEFDEDNAANYIPRRSKDIGKVKEFDIDFHRVKNCKLDHTRPVERFKVEPFRVPSAKLGMLEPKQTFIEKDSLEYRPKHEDFKLDMKHDDLKMGKPRYERVVRRPTHYFEHTYKHRRSIPFQYNNLEDSRQKWHGFGERLQPEKNEPEFQQFEKKSDQLYTSDKLMNAAFKKIDGKILAKPFSGLHEEFHDLRDKFNYFKGNEHSFIKDSHFPVSVEHLEDESEKLVRGNELMGSGFDLMESMEMSPRFNALKGGYHHLDDSRAKLDEAENFIKGINFDDGFGHIENEGGRLFYGNDIMENQFLDLQDDDLNKKYNDLESNLDEPLISGYRSRMNGDDFKKSFGFMSSHVNKLGEKNMLLHSGSDMMNFPSFGT